MANRFSTNGRCYMLELMRQVVARAFCLLSGFLLRSMARFLCLAAAALGSAAAFVVPIYSICVERTALPLQQQEPQQKQEQHKRNEVVTSATALSVAREAVDGATREGEKHLNGEGVVGVIVCDHGSRRENANEMLFDVVKRYQSFAGVGIAEVGGVEKPRYDRRCMIWCHCYQIPGTSYLW